MAISGLQTINVGLPNEAANSDSLYTAFNKTKNNFANLFACASPYNTFTAGNGISTNANSSLGTVTIENTGVTSLTAGTGIVLSGNTGNVTISATAGNGNGGGGTVTSVSVVGAASNARIATSGNPVITAGIITLDLQTSGVTAGTYTYPTLTIDGYGRVTSAANAASVGTVSSIGLSAGAGIAVTGSPVTTSGTITVINTGVTRLNAGTNISLSGANGNVTISATGTGTVTSVALTSNALTITGSPVTTAGSISIDLPSNISVTGNLTGGNLITGGRVLLSGSEDLADAAAANLLVTASYFSTGASGETATLAAGTAGLIKTFMMSTDGGGDMVITVTNAAWGGAGTITFADVGDGCTLQYINSKWFCIGNNGCTFA